MTFEQPENKMPNNLDEGYPPENDILEKNKRRENEDELGEEEEEEEEGLPPYEDMDGKDKE